MRRSRRPGHDLTSGRLAETSRHPDAIRTSLTTGGLCHTFASHFGMRGKLLEAVQEALGHESIETTLRYAHLRPDVKRDAVQVLNAPSVPSNGNLTAMETVQ